MTGFGRGQAGEILTAYSSVVNLAKAIVETAEEATHDPYLSRVGHDSVLTVLGRMLLQNADPCHAS